jgi:hypothetical protein
MMIRKRRAGARVAEGEKKSRENDNV